VEVCPVILTLQVFNKMMTSCAAIFDILVVCPKNFSVTLNLSKTDPDLPDTFVVVINDTGSSHRLVLSSMVSPVTVVTSHWASAAKIKMAALETSGLSEWTGVFTVLVLFHLGLVTLFVLYFCVKVRATSKGGNLFETKQTPSAKHVETAVLNNQPHNQVVFQWTFF
jgi:hypothetical protein